MKSIRKVKETMLNSTAELISAEALANEIRCL